MKFILIIVAKVLLLFLVLGLINIYSAELTPLLNSWLGIGIIIFGIFILYSRNENKFIRIKSEFLFNYLEKYVQSQKNKVVYAANELNIDEFQEVLADLNGVITIIGYLLTSHTQTLELQKDEYSLKDPLLLLNHKIKFYQDFCRSLQTFSKIITGQLIIYRDFEKDLNECKTLNSFDKNVKLKIQNILNYNYVKEYEKSKSLNLPFFCKQETWSQVIEDISIQECQNNFLSKFEKLQKNALELQKDLSTKDS